jgi:hypothetical protein
VPPVDDSQNPNGGDAKRIAAAFLTVTLVAGGFWWAAWAILDYFGA